MNQGRSQDSEAVIPIHKSLARMRVYVLLIMKGQSSSVIPGAILIPGLKDAFWRKYPLLMYVIFCQSSNSDTGS